MAWLNDWREKPVIKVVTGVRRCGKSTLFKLYIDSLLERGVKPEQIVSINLEELEYEQLSNYRELYAYLKARLYDGGTTYVFIDEVQQCKGFEKAVDSLFVKGNADVHITGSNAFLLSGELATLLSGRYVQLRRHTASECCRLAVGKITKAARSVYSPPDCQKSVPFVVARNEAPLRHCEERSDEAIH
ncbi:MAG: AAA family ATPase [Clostridiales Family XIII bacterium]|nr:AAA family ATPase [Clostridiales Family XIII bacterium]